MNWNEEWLKAPRPPASKHEKKYSFWPSGQGRWVLAYFIFITLLDYVALTTIGRQPILLLGMPLLIWITVIFGLLTICGMFLFSPSTEKKRKASVEATHEED